MKKKYKIKDSRVFKSYYLKDGNCFSFKAKIERGRFYLTGVKLEDKNQCRILGLNCYTPEAQAEIEAYINFVYRKYKEF